MSKVVRLSPSRGPHPVDEAPVADHGLSEVPAYWLGVWPRLRLVQPNDLGDAVCRRHDLLQLALRVKLDQAEHEARQLAAAHGIGIEPCPPGACVWPANLGDPRDPYEFDHYAESWTGVLARVRTYIRTCP